VWRSPLNSPFIHADIVRKEGSFPKHPEDGVTVYEGRDENFTDTGLTNGKKYHYSIFTHDDGVTARGYSKPVLVAMVPRDGVEQINFLEPSVIVTPPVASGELRFGMRSAEVNAFQTLLAKDRSIYPEGIVSGYFGPLTQAAVKRLQTKHGLPQTGVADAKTQHLLNSSSIVPAVPVPTTSANTVDLRPGAQGDDVKALQEFLKAQGVYPEGLITGFYGKFTYEAVLRFQKKYDLRPYTGSVDGETRKKMQELMGQ
jgi:peptidoglycan hydrolase-like protein with peptidoglycan-binding domain